MNEAVPPIVSYVPPKRRGLKIYATLVSIFFVLSLFANFVLFVVIVGLAGGPQLKHGLKEIAAGGDEHSHNKIAIIEINGMIGEGMVDKIKNRLDVALEDHAVKAILFKMDTPGGGVTASDTIYEAVKKAAAQKPVVVHIGALGASGGYYISMGATKVMATDTSVTGSIGVIAQSFNFTELMDKVGVKPVTYKSGRNKDIMSPFREPLGEEKDEKDKIMNAFIGEMYERFLGIVADARKIPADELRNGLADGRVLTGKQALQAKLIDATGNFEAAVDIAKSLAKISDAAWIKYDAPFSFGELFSAKATAPSVQVNVLPPTFQIESGKMYYLSHHLGF